MPFMHWTYVCINLPVRFTLCCELWCGNVKQLSLTFGATLSLLRWTGYEEFMRRKVKPVNLECAGQKSKRVNMPSPNSQPQKQYYAT